MKPTRCTDGALAAGDLALVTSPVLAWERPSDYDNSELTELEVGEHVMVLSVWETLAGRTAVWVQVLTPAGIGWVIQKSEARHLCDRLVPA